MVLFLPAKLPGKIAAFLVSRIQGYSTFSGSGVYTYKLHIQENQTKILDQHRATSKRIAEQGLLKPPLHKTQQFEMSTLYKGIDVWNRIPQEIKAIKTVSEFKTKLQKHTCKTTH